MIATPGRLLDKADRMIDTGFEDQVVKVLDAMPLRAGENEVCMTTMMFSATMPRALEKLTRKYLPEPVSITVVLPGQVTDLVRMKRWGGSREFSTTLDCVCKYQEVC